MGAVQYLFALALRPLVDGMGQAIADPSARAEEIRNQLTSHLSERRAVLAKALHRTNEQAWRILEVALAGEPLWVKAQVVLGRAEDEANRRKIRAFLDSGPLPEVAERDPEFSRQCLEELRQAREEGHLTPAELDLGDLLKKVGDCLRPSDPENPNAEDQHVLQRMAEIFRQSNSPALSALLGGPSPGVHLLTATARHLFRRVVEEEHEPVLLAQLAAAPPNGDPALALAALVDTLPALGGTLETLLRELRQTAAVASNAPPVDLASLEREAHAILDRMQLRGRPVRPGDCLAFAGDEDGAAQARRVVAEIKALPEGGTPALLEAAGVLEVALGMFDEALQDFQRVSAQTPAGPSQARARWNAYQVALVQSLWSEALDELKKAVLLDPDQFALFPPAYAVERILGLGGFGVSFLCRTGRGEEKVAVRSVYVDWLDRSVDDLFRELRVLKEADHPSLTRIVDFGLVKDDPRRPFIVTEYLDGPTLSLHLETNAAMGPAAQEVARKLAEALQAAQARGVWHHHLTPSNVFLRLDGSTWTVKLTDVGLGLRPGVIHTTIGNPSVRSHTVIGRSVSAIYDFAAPEQLGLLDGVEAGPDTNTYNFGRLGYFMLLGNSVPDDDEKEALPEPWRKLLGQCVARSPERRPAGAAAVLERLAHVSEAAAPAAAAETAAIGGPPTAPATATGDAPSGVGLHHAVPRDAKGFHDRGVAYAAKGAYDKAIADFNRSLEYDPQFASAFSHRGEMFRLKGDLERAFADFNLALRADPRHVAGYVNRGRVYRIKGRLDRALHDFTQAHRLDPKNADTLVNRGNAHSDRGEHDKAIADYTEALRLDPNLGLAYVNRGLAQAKRGDFNAVVADCTAALKINPKLGGAYFIRGAAHASKGEHDKAIADFTRVLALEPNHALAYNDRGLAHANKGEYDKAIGDYNRALRREPKLTLAYVNRAIAYRLKGEFDKAVAEFTKMLRLTPKNVLAYTNRGLAYLARKDFDRAIADFTEALWIDPACTEAYNRRVEAGRLKAEKAKADEERRQRDLAAKDQLQRRQERATAHFTRAQMHFDNGNFDKAIADYTEALKYDPKDAFTYYHRGIAQAANEDYDKALADYTEAIRLSPKLSVAYYHRGIGYRLRGNFARAIADFTEAIKLDAKHAQAFRNRGLAYAALGEQTRAKADYDEAIRIDPTMARK